MSTFVLCEDGAQVEEARRREPTAQIVVTTPESLWYCQRASLPFVVFDDYVSDSDLNRFGDRATAEMYAWAAWLDVQVVHALSDIASPGFAPARSLLYYLKRSLDTYLIPSWILRNFARATGSSRFVVFDRQPEFFVNFDSAPGRPIHGWLAPAALQGMADVEVWPATSNALRGPQPPSRLSRQLRRLAPAVLRRRLTRVLRTARARLGGLRLAWVARGYDWEYVVPLLERRGVRVIECVPRQVLASVNGNDARGEEIGRRFEDLWVSIAGSAELWKPTDCVTPALRDVITPFVAGVVRREMPRAWMEFTQLRQWLVANRIDATISVDPQSPFVCSALMASGSLGIPRVVSLHTPPGGAADLPVQDMVGPIQSDVYLLNGVGDEAYFSALADRFKTFPRAQNVSVGSVRLEQLAETHKKRARQLTRARPVLLYVPNAFEGFSRYFNLGHFSDVAHFQMQQRMLRCCAAFPEVRVLYKPHPANANGESVPAFIREFVPNARIVSTPLVDLIWSVDAIVFEFPSTGLAEASMTNKPLIVHAGTDWARLMPTAREALRKRALVSESIDQFDDNLRAFLSAGDFNPVTAPDDTFRRLYVTHLNDGHAAGRTADLVASVLAQRTAANLGAPTPHLSNPSGSPSQL